MARLVFGMNLSLDGYVDHEAFAPDPELFRHWTAQVAGLTGSIYGRTLYEIMQYWDEDQPGWEADEHKFAAAWRRMRKWVVSTTLAEVGPNAVLIRGDVEGAIRKLKAEEPGEIDLGGPVLAAWAGERGLIDEYRLYYQPVVLGQGAPFFAGPPPELLVSAVDRIGAGTVRVTCVPV
ncbi:MAG: dihydrofolate reductase family protein [Tabrizicola sp.]|jgi:dihydrofolate reductase|nr:dihydrofolate reductase family protein [Tabrizicola sp.]